MKSSDRFREDGLIIERHETREGPSPYFVAYHLGESRGFFDTVELMAWLRLQEGDDKLLRLRQWLQALSGKS